MENTEFKERLARLAQRLSDLDPTPYYLSPDQVVVPTGFDSKQIKVCYILAGNGVLVRRDTLAMSIVRHLPAGDTLDRLAAVKDGHLYTAAECGVEPADLPAVTSQEPGYGVIRTLADLFRAAPGHEEVYALCKSGVCMIYRSGTYALVQTGVTAVPGLPTLTEPAVEWKFGPPPESLWRQFQQIARAVDQKQGTEVGAILLYDLEQRRYVLTVPFQTDYSWTYRWYAVKGGRCPLTTPEYVDPRYVFVGVIHSHRSAGAFESGTDRDCLHKPMEIGLSVIMGKVHADEPDMKFFLIAGGEKTSGPEGVASPFVASNDEVPVEPKDWWSRLSTRAPNREIEREMDTADAAERPDGYTGRWWSSIPDRRTHGYSDAPKMDRKLPVRSAEDWKRSTTGFRVTIGGRSKDTGRHGASPRSVRDRLEQTLQKLSFWDRRRLERFLDWLDREVDVAGGGERVRKDILFPILYYVWRCHADEVWEALEYADGEEGTDRRRSRD